MSITDSAGVRFALAMGADRVTLARELSLTEIRRIYDETGADLEIFCHGALCVAYSGQCFSSEAWGGRSANRGQCAQACRLPYDLIVDGDHEPLADARYLLSPGDLLYCSAKCRRLLNLALHACRLKAATRIPTKSPSRRRPTAKRSTTRGQGRSSRSRRPKNLPSNRCTHADSDRTSSPAPIIRRSSRDAPRAIAAY